MTRSQTNARRKRVILLAAAAVTLTAAFAWHDGPRLLGWRGTTDAVATRTPADHSVEPVGPSGGRTDRHQETQPPAPPTPDTPPTQTAPEPSARPPTSAAGPAIDAPRSIPPEARERNVVPPNQARATPIPGVPTPPPAELGQAAPEPVVPLPLARSALTTVGLDPEAEDAWATAINDPSLPPHARKDLIEDLNEEGFEDPKHLTPDDLPLIFSRLELIEDMAPDAMDEVNAAAFEEAYKDLLKMADRVLAM